MWLFFIYQPSDQYWAIDPLRVETAMIPISGKTNPFRKHEARVKDCLIIKALGIDYAVCRKLTQANQGYEWQVGEEN